MDVQSAIQAVSDFVSRNSAFGTLRIEVSDPWHFNHCRGTHIPFGGVGGIYLLTKPGNPWDCVASSNAEPVWYVGTSEKDVGGRVWGHIGTIYDKETRAPNVPRFKHHRWANTKTIDEAIRECVSEGDVVIYTIAISSKEHGRINLLPAVLEKYVLVECAMRSGELPPLNLCM